MTQFTGALPCIGENIAMQRTEHLLVYRYEYWDERTCAVRASERYATLDSIKKGLGVPLLHTAKVVPREKVVNGLAA